MVNEKFLKPYNFQETEARIYKTWLDSGFFNPDNLEAPEDKAFTIVMPPPNVTGILHLGHSLMLTLEDIMIRYKRMSGFKTLWLPGTDHAAIATQSKVEKEIQKKEGLSRHDLGREEMLKRINQFAQESHDTISSQIKVMGASCDWSREAFTMDEKRNLAVRTVFKKMYDDGLIYRGHRIVNWDPKGQTTISDDEINYEEREAKLYTFKYSKDFPISISTTRPETKLGDVAVAVHPDDERYQKYIGQEYDVVFCGTPIHLKIIADKIVEKDFGTGALGVTPAHSFIDWQIATDHHLPKDKIVINERAKISVANELVKDKKVLEAREIIVAWLKEQNLLEKEEVIKQNIATAERTGGIVEPMPKLQWFINVNGSFKVPDNKINGVKAGEKVTLKEIMTKTVASGQIKIIPEYFEKTYFHWIDNLNDWCISRQIWYGHRLPVWYRKAEQTPNGVEEVYCGLEAPGGIGWEQDSDTLDTWFSSALWTFSTLGWPENTKDLRIYHPTNVLETGYEILFFWIARMILMTGYVLGDIPFDTVYLHGTVRDAKGRKMSKSLGNGIDPIEISQKFGADAVRMALIVGNTPGTDSKISEDKVKGYKNFANKIWNATRFVLGYLEDFDYASQPELTMADQASLQEFHTFLADITKDMEAYRFYMASDKIYNYFWHTFADVLIERSKVALNGTEPIARQSAQYLLWTILENSIRILHPFMPFVTEEIWSLLPVNNKKLLMIETWPKA